MSDLNSKPEGYVAPDYSTQTPLPVPEASPEVAPEVAPPSELRDAIDVAEARNDDIAIVKPLMNNPDPAAYSKVEFALDRGARLVKKEGNFTILNYPKQD